jgi:hypothetical protein
MRISHFSNVVHNEKFSPVKGNMVAYSNKLHPNPYKWCKSWDAVHTVRMG